jgi:hypothetical protein
METESCKSVGDIYLKDEIEKDIRTWGSHSCGYEEFYLLEYNAV